MGKIKKPYFIGIAGGTGSGKTLLAKKLASADPENCLVIEHDSYYKSRSKISPWDHNFDYPGALDNKLLITHIKALFEGKPVKIPIYDFKRHVRTKKRKLVYPKPVIILEGLFALESEALRKLMDLKIFIDIDPDLRLGYRLLRDIKERGYKLEEALDYYLKTARVMHKKWVEPTKYYADLIITNLEGDFIVATDVLLPKIREELKKRL